MPEKKVEINQIRQLIHEVGFKPTLLILPVFLAVAAALSEGLSMYLLIPTVKGIFERDYSFMRGMGRLQFIINLFPENLHSKNSFIFFFLVSSIFLVSCAKYLLAYQSEMRMQSLILDFICELVNS